VVEDGRGEKRATVESAWGARHLPSR
jgi:hypothetical protein